MGLNPPRCSRWIYVTGEPHILHAGAVNGLRVGDPRLSECPARPPPGVALDVGEVKVDPLLGDAQARLDLGAEPFRQRAVGLLAQSADTAQVDEYRLPVAPRHAHPGPAHRGHYVIFRLAEYLRGNDRKRRKKGIGGLLIRVTGNLDMDVWHETQDTRLERRFRRLNSKTEFRVVKIKLAFFSGVA